MRPCGLFQEESLLFDYPSTGRMGVKLRALDVPSADLTKALAGAALREDDLAGIPQISEFETIRHFTRLSKWNTSIDAAMYPLGSCTMKYNPRINEAVARTPGFDTLHPLLPESLVQGALEMLHTLEKMLLEITGFSAVTLQSAAGAQGELCGVLLIKARLHAKGETRQYMLAPDSAHGTNPASANLAGYAVKEVRSTAQGTLDIDHLKELMTEDVAGLMLTNPNTLGIFEPEVAQIADIVHRKGGYIYCDGANMNAQVGAARPADYGMDVMHLNLHKTFSTPHGGGGPGAGPCLCTEELAPYLPVPRIEKHREPPGERYSFNWQAPESIGKLTGFYGNFGILVRALSYLMAMGGDGLTEMTRVAVLNANYLRKRLSKWLHVATQYPTMHEVVFSDKGLADYGGISVLDLAKRLLDYGFHPPTTYFPLTVHGAFMVEPTESEPKEELDRFVEAIETILQEAKDDPELVKTAPHLMPRSRLDEAGAARNLSLRWVAEKKR